jgi:hypothetical protein
MAEQQQRYVWEPGPLEMQLLMDRERPGLGCVGAVWLAGDIWFAVTSPGGRDAIRSFADAAAARAWVERRVRGAG